MSLIHFYPKDSAMHGAVELRIFGGWVVWYPRWRTPAIWPRGYAFWSRNATSWHHSRRLLWGRWGNPPGKCVCDDHWPKDPSDARP